jgi:hypothetical protein
MDTSNDFFQETRSNRREHERKGRRMTHLPKRHRENVEAKRVTRARKIERKTKEERWLRPQYL